MSDHGSPASRAARLGLIGFAAVVLTLAAYYPVVAHPNSTVLLAPGDMSSSARDYWAANYQHKNPFTLVRDRLFEAPQGRPVAPAVQIANALQPLFVMAVHGFAGYLGAFNLFMLLGVAVSLAAMFVLLASIGMHPMAASAGAIAFGSCQWSVEQLMYGHIAFAQLWVFPLLLGSLLWAKRGRPIRSIVPGLAYALSFYAFSYLGLLSSLVVVVFLLAVVWNRRSMRVDLGRLGFGAGAAIVGLLPVAFATRIAPTSRLGLQLHQELFGATLRGFFLPSSRHVIYGQAVSDLVGSNVGEPVVFFGYGTMVLACVALAMLVTRRLPFSLPVRFALLAVPIGWFASLGGQQSILGIRVTLPDPVELIGGVVPWLREYARFAGVAGFGLVLLASASLDHLIRSGRRAYVAAAGLGIAVVVLEALPGLPVPTFRLQADAATTWLRAHPGGSVAMYPIKRAASGGLAYDNMYWSAYYLQVYHHHPIFEEPTGVPPATASAIAATLVGDLSDEETPAILRAEGVRWVVVHRSVYHAMGEPVPRLGRGFKIAARFPGVQVLRVTAPRANLRVILTAHAAELAHQIALGDAQVEFGDGFYGAEHFDRYIDAHWMQQNGELVIHPGDVPLPFVVYDLQIRAFSANVPRLVEVFEGSRRVASFEVPTSEVVINRRLRFPGTYSTLTFRAEPGPSPLGASDPRLASVYFESVAAAPVGLSLRTSNGQ